MKGLLWLLLLFALAVGVALAAHYNEGYLLMVLPPYRVELTLNLAVALIAGVFVVLYALLRAIAATLALPRRVRRYRERLRDEKAAASFYDVARLLFEGRYSQALRQANAAYAAGLSPALAALLAAYAARRLHEPQKQQAWLERARRADDAKMQRAVLMLEAQRLIDAGDFAAAGETLQSLQQLAGRHIAAMHLELRVAQGSGDSDEVVRIAHLLSTHDALSAEQTRAIVQTAHLQAIAVRRGDAPRLLAYAGRFVPDAASAPLALAYADALADAGEVARALEILEAQLERSWDTRLLERYLTIDGGAGVDGAVRRARAEGWLATHGDDARLLWLLGRLCRVQKVADKAQAYLEASLALAEGSELRRAVRLELACLAEQGGRADEALAHYRAACACAA